MVRTAAYEPVFITDEKGAGLMVYPMPSVQFPADRQHARDSINEALDALFRTLVTRTTLDEERAQTVTAIRRAMASRKQTLKSIARTVEESAKAERYKQIGEIILGSLHAIEKGAKSVTLPDFFDPEMPEVTIELDEKLEPQANAERYFKRYRKARDSVSSAESRRALIDGEIARLESALRECESAQTVESLRRLRSGLTSAGLLRQEVSVEKQESEFAGHRIRRVMADGWEILYGENSTSNDYLTQKVARPNDVWLHARQITGAHVVIRMAGRKGGAPRPVLARGRPHRRAQLRRKALLARASRPYPAQIRPQAPRLRARVRDLSQREDHRCEPEGAMTCAPGSHPVTSARLVSSITYRRFVVDNRMIACYTCSKLGITGATSLDLEVVSWHGSEQYPERSPASARRGCANVHACTPPSQPPHGRRGPPLDVAYPCTDDATYYRKGKGH